MQTKYESQLESVVHDLPDGGCLIALVATIETDHAAALARDFAQLVGRSRTGHTLLVSIEYSPPALDHEIGVEGGAGLTQVLAGASTLSEVAAHGRARGFIYVPGGDAPGPPSGILASRAFRILAGNAVGRGGAVLAFMPLQVLDGTEVPPVEGVVWLGPEPEAIPDGWRTLGTLLPPEASAKGSTVAAGPSLRAANAPAPIKISSPRRGSDARKTKALQRPFVAAAVATVLVLATALTVFVFVRSRSPASFLPENDSIWLQTPQVATPDSTS